MSDPLTSRGLWPAGQCQVPVAADRRQHGESPTLSMSGLAMVQKAVVVTVTNLKVTDVDHQERSHQQRLQRLQWQLLQQQHQQHFHSAEKKTCYALTSNKLLIQFRSQDSIITPIYDKPYFRLIMVALWNTADQYIFAL